MLRFSRVAQLFFPLLLLTLLSFRGGGQKFAHHQLARDWPQFGWDVASSGAPDFATGITAANVGSLTRRQVRLNGTVDASAIYLHGAIVNGAAHDTFFVTTSYGKTIAVDADTGAVLWEY